MKSAAEKKLAKRQRELETLRGMVTPSHGATPVQATALQVVTEAERARRAGDFNTASHLCEQLANVFGLVHEPFMIMLHVALTMQRPVEAMDCAQRLLAAGAKLPADLALIARAFDSVGRADEALSLVDKALRDAPADASLRELRTELLMELNRVPEAFEEARRVLRIAPGHAGALRTLATFGELPDSDFQQLEQRARSADASPEHYAALAAAHRRRGEREQEMACLDKAHQALAGKDWVPGSQAKEARAEATMEIFDADFFASQEAAPASKARPIFVVGMPRSGSTLVEQILVAADGVDSIGESSVWHWTLTDLASEKYGGAAFPEVALYLQPEDLLRLQRGYLTGVESTFTKAGIFVDKQFTNYLQVGLLAHVFPNASFVYTKRDAMDVCLSCYQQVLRGLEYGHSLEELAMSCQITERVMSHWQQMLPGRIHTLEYEALAQDPEPRIRELLAACDLPWQDEVMRFHESERPVRTASLAQVRRPISADSVGRWRDYDAFLGPLKSVLQA